MAGWYTARGGMEVDWNFTIFKVDNFLILGGMSMEDGGDTSRVGCGFSGVNETASRGDIDRDF